MFKERIFIVNESGETQTRMEETSCRPAHICDADIIHASAIMSIAQFIGDYEDRLQNPSFYADIQTIEIPDIPIVYKPKLSFTEKIITWLKQRIPIFR